MVNKKSITCFLLICIFGLNPNFLLFASKPRDVETQPKQLLQPSLIRFQLKQTSLNYVTEEFGASLSKVIINEHYNPNFQQELKPKTKGKAFLRSLILPGWGQYYAESRTMMKVFIVTEVLVWGAYFGNTTWSNWLEKDYRTLAVTHAGVNLKSKPHSYFVDIGNYNDIIEYNQAKLRDRNVSDLYPVSQEFHWQWDNEENRRKFESIRIRSDRAGNRAEFAIASIFLNHFVSAIHSTLAVHKYNRRLAEHQLGFKIYFEGFSKNRNIKLQLIKSF